ncbi:MAG: BlaI/MecI/CopY family transcriptional regulator [Gammaproteobacteria bacterium]|nr:BlaI/MecI/CopY family transcriptional regulator [Gammaproteobacteria bacterium]
MSNRVSESEQIVMEVLWQESPLSSQQVVERLQAQDWNEKTVKTFLNRMVKKGVLGFQTQGRKYLYFPKVEREVFIQEESDGFLNKVFKGNVKELLATFVQNKQLSKQELDYLKNLLDKEQG